MKRIGWTCLANTNVTTRVDTHTWGALRGDCNLPGYRGKQARIAVTKSDRRDTSCASSIDKQSIEQTKTFAVNGLRGGTNP